MNDAKIRHKMQINFGKNLEQRRKERGITRKDLAELIGIKETSYGAYCTGRNFPSIDKLIKLAVTLDCSITELVGDNPNVENSHNSRIAHALKITMAAGFNFIDIDKQPFTINLSSGDIFKSEKGLKTNITLEKLEFESIDDFGRIIEIIEMKAVTENITFKDALQKLIDSQSR